MYVPMSYLNCKFSMQTALIIAIKIIQYRRVSFEKLTVPQLVNKSSGF